MGLHSRRSNSCCELLLARMPTHECVSIYACVHAHIYTGGRCEWEAEQVGGGRC